MDRYFIFYNNSKQMRNASKKKKVMRKKNGLKKSQKQIIKKKMIWTKGWKKKQWEERKRKSKWKKMTKIKKRTLEGGYICPQYKKNFVPSFFSKLERLVFGGYKEKILEFHQNISNFQLQSNNPKNFFRSYVLSSLFSLQPNGLKKMHVTNLY